LPEAIAYELAKKQKEISVAEFFERNKHILGFGNPTRALITSVKEGVDNSLTKDMPIVIEDNSVVKIEKIGDLIDQKMKEIKPESLKNGQLERLKISGLKTLCFNRENLTLELKEISTLFRHKVNSDIYRVTLKGNRYADLTDYHSIFGFRDGRIKPMKTSELKEGDYLVVPNGKWDTPLILEIDLLEELLKLTPQETEKIGIYGINKIFLDIREQLLAILPYNKKYRINDFRKCDRIPFNILREITVDRRIFDHCTVDFKFGKHKIKTKIPITKDLAEFLGIYIAEGSISGGHKVNLSFGSHEKDLTTYVKNLFKAVWDQKATIAKAHHTAVNVVINSTILAFILKKIFEVGNKANTKRIPKFVFNFPVNYREKFLMAYLAGDGYPSKEIFSCMEKQETLTKIQVERITLATASKDLCSDLFYLLSSIGIDCTFDVNKPETRILLGKKANFSDSYILYIYIKQGISDLHKMPLSGIVENNKDSKLQYSINYNNQTQITVLHALKLQKNEYLSLTEVGEKLAHSQIGLLKVKNIEKINYDGEWVYDISVPGEENFMSGLGPIACHNSLDACEESGILPDIYVEVKNPTEEECIVIVEDNGPGIIKQQIPHIFARLLYGSRFHAVRQSRGQQGIGISAVVLYGQLTTGKHAKIISKIEENQPAVLVELAIDTNKNRGEIQHQEITHWDKPSGTRIEVSLNADYKRGKRFVYDYLQSTSIVNPHARIVFKEADGTEHLFERTADILPKKSEEIRPHPYGIELGTLIKMSKETKARKLASFLKNDFSSMGDRTANAVCDEAKLDRNLNPADMSREQFLFLYQAFKKVKIMAPPTECLSPIGETLIRRSLKSETQEISPEFIFTASRPASVFSGNPFQVEVGIVYGGNLPKDKPVKILRFANRIPLLYQQGDCAVTTAIASIDWRRYGLDQPSGTGIPIGPAIFLTHIASTQIPYTSESKEAIADVEEIENEIKLAFREVARKVQMHINKKVRRVKTREKFDLITKILPEIAKKSAHMLNKPVPSLEKVITRIMDVVWIEDLVEYEKVRGKQVQTKLDVNNPKGQTESGGWIAKSTIMVVNYKGKPQKFSLYALFPKNATVGEVKPKPTKITDTYIKWSLESIDPTDKIDLFFELAGLNKGDFDENDLYVQNINPTYVIGADKWEGE